MASQFSDTIPLSDRFSCIRVRNGQFVDALSFADRLLSPTVHVASVTDSLSFVDTNKAFDCVRALSIGLPDAIFISDEFLSGRIRASKIADSLTIADAYQGGGLRNVTVADGLAFSESLSTNKRYNVAVADVFQSIEQTLDSTGTSLVEQVVGLDDQFSVARFTTFAVVEQLVLTDRFPVSRIKADAKSAVLSDNLTISDEFSRTREGVGVDLLNPTDEYDCELVKCFVEALELADGFAVNLRGTRPLSDEVNVAESFFGLVETSVNLSQYHPFVDPSASGTPPVVLAGPVVGAPTPFQLVYPASGTVVDSVTLRAPNLGNKDRLSFNRVLRETRGGTLIVYADPIWPKTQTLALTFSGLYPAEAQALLSFFEKYLGQEIGLYDWEQRYWRGIVMTPDEPVVEDTRGRFSASFQFEGELATV